MMLHPLRLPCTLSLSYLLLHMLHWSNTTHMIMFKQEPGTIADRSTTSGCCSTTSTRHPTITVATCTDTGTGIYTLPCTGTGTGTGMCSPRTT
jgi:hypothetical protein